MPAKKASRRKARTTASKSKSKALVRKKDVKKSEERFVRDLLIRGEAARRNAEGELPSGATHVIVEENEDGLPTVKRERFSLY